MKRHHLLLGLLSAWMPALAGAHPGHDTLNFIHGLQHPWMGLDHLAAMIAVGMWAAQMGGKQRWWAPLSFVGVMLLGGALGRVGMQVGWVEQGIAASVLVLGLLVAFAVRLPLFASLSLVGCFALLHGYAHGAEAPANANLLSYFTGFGLSTLVLHGVGLLFALWGVRDAKVGGLRWVGAAVAVYGAVLCVS